MRPIVFVQHGGRSPLSEAAAHDHDDIVCSGETAGFFQLIFVSFVKRIVFRDDSCDCHGYGSVPFLFSWIHHSMDGEI